MDSEARGQTRSTQLEITVHFDEPKATSEEILEFTKRLGVDLDLTPRQLDKLRSRGPDLRRWLGADASRYAEFLDDPQAAFRALDARARSSTRTPQLPTASGVRWRGVGKGGAVAAAGIKVGQWLLAEPGRLALLQKDPTVAIVAALPEATDAIRSTLAARVLSDKPAHQRTRPDMKRKKRRSASRKGGR